MSTPYIGFGDGELADKPKEKIMSVSILEALQNAEINLSNGVFGLVLAKSQLHNAVTLLEKGYSVDDEIEPLLERHGAVESVPKNVRVEKGTLQTEKRTCFYCGENKEPATEPICQDCVDLLNE